MSRPIANLLYEARHALGLGSQGEMGEFLGSSARSGQRWERGQSTPSHDQLVRLMAAVYPRNAALAEEIAASQGTTLVQVGVVQPPPPPPPPAPLAAPPPPRPDPAHLVDTVVCAAAEAMNMMPEEIRPALRAAFRRARLAGLSVEDVDVGMGTTPGGDAQRG
ncbi:MAG TPA: helix-turn-helix transcriptional regulator [Polyangiaceae bacterium]|jgi:hypothetical protein